MLINDLIVTQNDLRNWSSLNSMIDFVINGGVWDKSTICNFSGRNASLITISKFEDGLLYVHDGHHRICATLIAGRDFLYDSEFQIIEWKYSDYIDYNPANNWFTPFDPRTHYRFADFFTFKDMIKKIHDENPYKAYQYHLDNKHLYLEERKFTHFNDLILKRNI